MIAPVSSIHFSEAFKLRLKLPILEYFFESINRIFAPGYVATDDDIIRARVRTTGILETRFKIGSLIYRVFVRPHTWTPG